MENNYYKKTLDYWDSRAVDYTREQKPKIISELLQSLKRKEAKYVLDVGCGPGYNAIDILSSLDCRMTCLDFSSEMIRAAKKNIKEAGLFNRASFLRGNIARVELKNDFFDAAMAISVFHYLLPNDIKKACQNIYKALKVGGILLIVEYWTKEKLSEFEEKTLNIANKARRLKNDLMANFLKDKEYFDLLKSSGFSRISKRYLKEPIYLDKYAKINPELSNEIAKLKTNSNNLISVTIIRAQKL